MKRAAFYLRVSTREQTTENQRLELERVATAKGWTVSAIYQDEGISGAKERHERPAFDKLLIDATRAKFDVILTWDVSRLGRSLMGLVQTLDDLHAIGIDLYLHQQAVDTTTPSGKAMFQMIGVFAEFERSMVRERVKSGLARAVARGTRLGRPTLDVDLEGLKADRAQGKSIRVIAKERGISVGRTHFLLSSLVAGGTD